jgi:hypothetical protein
VERLLAAGATPMTQGTGSHYRIGALILEWVNLADLLRIKGIGTVFRPVGEAGLTFWSSRTGYLIICGRKCRSECHKNLVNKLQDQVKMELSNKKLPKAITTKPQNTIEKTGLLDQMASSVPAYCSVMVTLDDIPIKIGIKVGITAGEVADHIHALNNLPKDVIAGRQANRPKVMKNWLPLVSGPEFAIATTPALSKLRSLTSLTKE